MFCRHDTIFQASLDDIVRQWQRDYGSESIVFCGEGGPHPYTFLRDFYPERPGYERHRFGSFSPRVRENDSKKQDVPRSERVIFIDT